MNTGGFYRATIERLRKAAGEEGGRDPSKADRDAILRFLGEAARTDEAFHAFLEKQGINPHKGEAAVYAFVHACLTPKDGMPERVRPRELSMGIEVEAEHTDYQPMAKKIALDHLNEMPDYYTRLQAMEAQGG